MSKTELTTTKTAGTTTTQHPPNRIAEICVSGRKLEPRATIGFAKKTPKFVVERKHTVTYER